MKRAAIWDMDGTLVDTAELHFAAWEVACRELGRGFTREDVDFLTEPFADPDKLRASWGNYESAVGVRPLSEPPRFFERNGVPTLALYGPEDHVIWRDFCGASACGAEGNLARN